MLGRSYRRSILEITVFVCGAVVMVFEIIGSRILSPFIGTSTYVWTSLIGVILASLSLGYWLGGRVADRRPDVRLLASIIFAAGGLISLTVLIKDVVLSAIASVPIGLEVKALAAAVLLFAPASICLGVVTPFAVRLKTRSLEQTGSTVGNLYAISTIGSILGTFAAGFFLIPFVGSVRTLYVIAASLLLMSALLAPMALSKTTIAVCVVFVLGIASSEITGHLLFEESGLRDIDTEYNRVRIFRATDPASGRPIEAMAIDPFLVQSAVFTDSDELVFDYARYYHLIRYFKPDFRETLMIGGAGYSFPMDYLKVYPEARIDVAEIDPGMTAIARKYFRLKDDPRLQIIHQDGRMFLNQAPAAKYDAVLMDAFGTLFSVPYHLTTAEAVRNISRVLKPGGAVILNLGSSITGPASGFLQAELATYRSVFPTVYLYKVNAGYPDTELQNLIIAASKSPEPQTAASDDPLIRSLLAHQYTPLPETKTPPLTDDLAPVEYYNSTAQNLYLSTR